MSTEFVADALAALHAACFVQPRPWSASEFIALRNDPSTLFLVERDGFLAGRIIADEAEILTLAVAPDGRRKGVARRLIDAFHEAASEKSVREVFLEVSRDNQAATQLYLTSGYSQAGLRPGYYRNEDGVRVDALVLRRAL